VQADPIRAPARAQDLTLRHRVSGYRAGDLERRYAALGIEEDFFVNYGFLPRASAALMHPRIVGGSWGRKHARHAKELLAFVRDRGQAHPREVDAHFAHGRVTNWFGGTTNATTQLLDAMHYRGMLRIAKRTSGVRVYALREPSPGPEDAAGRRARLDDLIDLLLRSYAPLPAQSLSGLVSRLRYGAPQWQRGLRDALARAKRRLAHAHVEGTDWYWPADEEPRDADAALDDAVRLLAPFDPLVWDRRRFEAFWGWAYRFEAYTPPAQRRLGYYALPLLWRDRVIGWGNLAVAEGRLRADFGYASGRAPRDARFRRGLELELDQFAHFLGVTR
jgi:uncharacterized protein YcaQ